MLFNYAMIKNFNTSLKRLCCFQDIIMCLQFHSCFIIKQISTYFNKLHQLVHYYQIIFILLVLFSISILLLFGSYQLFADRYLIYRSNLRFQYVVFVHISYLTEVCCSIIQQLTNLDGFIKVNLDF